MEVAPRSLKPKPLYRQVRDELVRRIVEGAWAAGQAIPSEFEIAADLGVSQGTVRKALDEMAAERLVVRLQGKGTFVARHDDARILFQFFRLLPDTGEVRFPESRVLGVTARPATRADAQALGIAAGAPVIAFERVRFLDATPCILERIVLSEAMFPGLAERGLPNNLYDLYATAFGVTIAGATERLKAMVAGPHEAEHLAVAPGTPLLVVDRIATALDGRIGEWRVSICRTDHWHYKAELR